MLVPGSITPLVMADDSLFFCKSIAPLANTLMKIRTL